MIFRKNRKKIAAFILGAGFMLAGSMGAAAAEAETEKTLEPVVLSAAELTGVKSYESGCLQISWKEVENADGYQVYRQNPETKKYEKIAELIGGKTLSYLDTGRKNGTKYSYKVRAYEETGGKMQYGPWSAVKTGWSIGKSSIKRITSLEKGALEITWKSVADVYRYQLYRSTTENGTYTKIAALKSNQTAYTDTTAKPGKTYYYKIRTVNRVDGTSGYGSDSKAVSGILLAKPKITGITSQGKSLKIQWNKADGAGGYYIYRSTSKNGTYQKIATVKSGGKTSYTDKNVTQNRTYYYKIQAYNKNNKIEGLGKRSAAKSGKTLPSASIQKVINKSDKQLTISWKQVTGATGYEIARSTAKNGKYEIIKTVKSGKTTSYTDKNLLFGKKYYYKVRAIKIKNGLQGWGSYSGILSGQIKPAATITKVQSAAGEAVRISWKSVSNATGYQIYRSTSQKGSYVKVATVDGKTAYDDTVPKTNKVYYYKVRPYNRIDKKSGTGTWSAVDKGKALKTPEIKTVKLLTNGAVSVKWKEVSGAGGYLLYRKAGNGSYTKIATINDKSTVTYFDSDVKSGVNYYYKVKAKNVYNGIKGSSGYSEIKAYCIPYYEIMGVTTLKASQMAACFKATGYTYPASVYEKKGAATIEEFAQIVCEEAAEEGVRAEVLWGQIILETGWLQFKGSMVKPSQCNFGGLGATDNSGGAYVAAYQDVRTGIRAQVQHLKAYASTEALKNKCVDTRFSLVKRGCAVYVEWLGQKENPLGYGWATGQDYGHKIRRLINQTSAY